MDTFEVTKSRPWYSWALAAPMQPGTTSPYGNGLYSAAEGSHVIGMKQYELVNHLANVQETISDKKWSKDNNGDSVRDEYRAVPVMVYDYYPFGQLMPGRSLDTAGLCATYSSYVEVPHFHRPALVALSGNASAYGSASLTGQANGGVTAGGLSTGTSGGFSYTITGIPSSYITLDLSFAYLRSSATITVYSGTNTGSGSTILAGPILVSYIAPAVSQTMAVGSGALSSGGATITVVVTAPLGQNVPLFTVDSINYMWLTYTLNKTLYTQCGDPKDKYEFGYNGQMKTNEIAGVGNHNTALFWEYDTRLGRRWNIDPVVKHRESGYATNGNNPIANFDLLGNDFTDKNGSNVSAGEGITANSDGTIITNTGKNRNWDYGTWNEETGSYDLANYELTDGLSAGELLDYGRIDLYSASSARAAGNLYRKAEAKSKGEGSYLRNIIVLEQDHYTWQYEFYLRSIVAPVDYAPKVQLIGDLDVVSLAPGGGGATGALAKSGTTKPSSIIRGLEKMGNIKGRGIEKLPGKVAKELGIDPHEFSKFIHEVKESEGRGNTENFTYQELLELGEQYKSGK